MTVGAAVQYLLSDRGGGAAYVVGSQALVDHVAEAGMRIVNRTEFATRADVVVVGGHEEFELRRAARSPPRPSIRGAELIGADARRDASRCPTGRGRAPARCSPRSRPPPARTADRIVGKPEPPMYEAARDRLGEGRCLAVGDRLEIDVAGARRAGMDSALVLTGGTTRAEADAADPAPTHVADSLAALVLQ